MFSVLVLSWPSILQRLFIGAVVGCGSYFLWRLIQEKIPFLLVVSTVLLGLALKFISEFAELYFIRFYAWYLLIPAVACLFGNPFYRNIGNKRISAFSSFLLLYVAAISSLSIGLKLLQTSLVLTYDGNIEVFYYLSLVVYPSVTPFLIWVWQKLALRPGIDKHFETEN